MSVGDAPRTTVVTVDEETASTLTPTASGEGASIRIVVARDRHERTTGERFEPPKPVCRPDFLEFVEALRSQGLPLGVTCSFAQGPAGRGWLLPLPSLPLSRSRLQWLRPGALGGRTRAVFALELLVGSRRAYLFEVERVRQNEEMAAILRLPSASQVPRAEAIEDTLSQLAQGPRSFLRRADSADFHRFIHRSSTAERQAGSLLRLIA
jgi:hypothetical protein